jgi:kynurenine formamidase
MSTLIDLGHAIQDGMAAYPGLPPPRVFPLVTHEESRDHYHDRAEFALTKLDIAGNTGTYLDSPWHRFPEGIDIAGIPLAHVANLRGMVVDATPSRSGNGIEVDVAAAAARGAALLIRTGWSQRWGSDDYWSEGPHLSLSAIARISEAAPRLVGVDFSNVDDLSDPARPAHTRLLGAGILIVEHMCHLDRLADRPFRLHCAPLPVRGTASIPVRPYALIEEHQ